MHCLRLLVLVIAASLTGSAFAGDLTPPPGPVGPTGKPIGEIEPRIPVNTGTLTTLPDAVFTVIQPGSYYLTQNIFAPAGKSGIRIDVSNVTIDLNGFTIAGEAGSLAGITSVVDDIAVRNGRIESMGSGISLTGARTTIEDVDVINCGGTHVQVGDSARISRVRTDGTLSSTGFVVGQRATLIDCLAEFHAAGAGFSSGDDATYVRCTSSNNQAGFVLENGTRMETCVARQNDGTGIFLRRSGVLIDCEASDNGSFGIDADRGGHILERCTANNNGLEGIFIRIVGEDPGELAVLRGCVASGNGANGAFIGANASISGCGFHDNGSGGLLANGQSVTIVDCVANDNSSDGIIGLNAVIERCGASRNGGYGFDVGGRSVIRDSNAQFNELGGYVVGAQSNAVRVESCVAVNNLGIGFTIFGEEVLVVRCSAFDNSGVGFLFSGTTIGGPIVSTTGGTISTNNPWANFTDSMAPPRNENGAR